MFFRKPKHQLKVLSDLFLKERIIRDVKVFMKFQLFRSDFCFMNSICIQLTIKMKILPHLIRKLKTLRQLKSFFEGNGGSFLRFYKFFQESKEGKLDKTTQFWTSYINFMHLYHDFTQSIRMVNLEVFISYFLKLKTILFCIKLLYLCQVASQILRYFL